MKKEIQHIIDSNLLEDYLFGLCTEDQAIDIASKLQSSAELREAYQQIQDDIELMASKGAIQPPADLKTKVMDAVEQADDTPSSDISSQSSTTPKTKTNWLPLLLLAFFGGLAGYFFLQYQNTLKELDSSTERMFALQELAENKDKTIKKMHDQIQEISDPNTLKVGLAGNNLSPDFQVEAFWNTEKESAYIYLENIPKLANNKCFQMWADVDGEMVNVGLLQTPNDKFIKLAYHAEATSLNVTIEKAGGSNHPDVSQLVASVEI